MKTVLYIIKRSKSFLPAFFLIVIVSTGFCQNNDEYTVKSVLDVTSWYKGWRNDPDTIKVYADSTFTTAEKDSIQKAINRWNGTGSKPKMKMTNTNPADVNITTDGSLAAGTDGETTTYHNPSTGKTSKADVAINPNHPGIGLVEVVTHELGHCLGLDDTDQTTNATDVMKGKDPNGTSGGLSNHDSAEIKSAADAQVKDKKHALAPTGAIPPGTFCSLSFDLGQTYPPAIAAAAIIQIDPVLDINFQVQNSMVNGNLLIVNAFLDATHWSGEFFLDISIVFPPPYGTNEFLGWHFAHIDPVPPTTFTCPFEVNAVGDLTYVYWENNCTYPIPGAGLRSHLTINDSIEMNNKGGGPYVLELKPGTYTLRLDVDDYEGNSATSSQTIVLTGTNDNKLHGKDLLKPYAYPNPFTRSCTIFCDPKAQIDIVDAKGNLIEHLGPGIRKWNPQPGIQDGTYIMKIISGSESKSIKVVFAH